jgi:hypothetical protein
MVSVPTPFTNLKRYGLAHPWLSGTVRSSPRRTLLSLVFFFDTKKIYFGSSVRTGTGPELDRPEPVLAVLLQFRFWFYRDSIGSGSSSQNFSRELDRTELRQP